VEAGRSVKAEADQEAPLFEKPAPVIVQERSIGLKGVGDPHPRSGISLLEAYGSFEKIHAHEEGLPSLPGEDDLRNRLGPNVVPGEGLESLIGHPKCRPWV